MGIVTIEYYKGLIQLKGIIERAVIGSPRYNILQNGTLEVIAHGQVAITVIRWRELALTVSIKLAAFPEGHLQPFIYELTKLEDQDVICLAQAGRVRLSDNAFLRLQEDRA